MNKTWGDISLKNNAHCQYAHKNKFNLTSNQNINWNNTKALLFVNWLTKFKKMYKIHTVTAQKYVFSYVSGSTNDKLS